MEKEQPEANQPDGRRVLNSRLLREDETYRCPICRHGELAQFTLMEAFACNFCRHIFIPNFSAQTIQVVDSAQPITWRWTGTQWRMANQGEIDLTVLLWIIGAVLLVLPGSLVALAAYLFPPLPNSSGAWFPSVWIGVTFFVHLLMVLWLLAEYYQVPLYVTSRIRLRRMWQ